MRIELIADLGGSTPAYVHSSHEFGHCQTLADVAVNTAFDDIYRQYIQRHVDFKVNIIDDVTTTHKLDNRLPLEYQITSLILEAMKKEAR